ncbi:hypothetical protein AAES_03148 [Amazona aestiva]|uniref:Uncharacterized protein n=1 Tax=Amazona aestiva TaxID=12930 RepID=A0A0Q3XB85_AMAAE|nr:hypothetical protein AAES_03148 [Amazona aestiva]
MLGEDSDDEMFGPGALATANRRYKSPVRMLGEDSDDEMLGPGAPATGNRRYRPPKESLVHTPSNPEKDVKGPGPPIPAERGPGPPGLALWPPLPDSSDDSSEEDDSVKGAKSRPPVKDPLIMVKNGNAGWGFCTPTRGTAGADISGSNNRAAP